MALAPGGYSANGATCNSGITNTGKQSLASLWAVLTAGLAAYNTGQAVYFATQQYEIASDYLKIAKWWHDYKRSYFDPVEDQEINEASSLGEETPYYDTQAGRAMTAGRIRFKNAVNKAVQCTSEYCTGLRQQLARDLIAQEAATTSSLCGLGFRNERAFIEARSDARWKRMIGAASRGRGMQANAVNMAQLSFGIFGDLGSAAGKSAMGAAALSGYLWNHNTTIYPTTFKASGAASAPDPAQAPLTTSGAVITGNGLVAAGDNF